MKTKIIKFIAILLALLNNSLLIAQPIVNSLSSNSGIPGTSITITGTNFNATPANNIVYFGATKATVTAASTTSLTVTVPLGATYAPVTVNNTAVSLIGNSPYSFLPKYDNSLYIPGIVSFDNKIDFSTGSQPFGNAIGDIDGDGKSDVVVVNYSSNTMSVFRNTGAGTSISLGSRIDFATGNNPVATVVNDIDGDGKLDVVITNGISNTVSVFRNISTVGAISFAAKVDCSVGNGPVSVSVVDLDNDGKLDIVTANQNSNNMTIVRNSSLPGTVSLSFVADYAVGGSAIRVSSGDIDGDGKPDMAVVDQTNNELKVFRNVSSGIGSFSFGSYVSFAAGVSIPWYVMLGDMDGDGKPDMVMTNPGSGTMSIYRNTSTSGVIAFATKIDYTAGTNTSGLAVGDIDGDGRPDIAVGNVVSNNVSVFVNRSTSGVISFSTKVDFATGSNPYGVVLGDLNGDNKPDLIVSNYASGTVSILRNNPLVSPPAITSLSNSISSPGTSITITGTNFNATPANNIVYFGATKATVTAASTTSLTVTAPVGATYAPVSVINNAVSLAGYSQYPFLPKYDNNAYIAGLVNFDPKVDFTAGNETSVVKCVDFDGDGKVDIAAVNYLSNTLSIYRNISSGSTLSTGSFAAKVDFTTGSGPNSIGVGDLDGDGKLDIIVGNYVSSGTISVFRNTSVPGVINTSSFASKVDYAAGAYPGAISIADIDLDGKPEILVGNADAQKLAVFQNATSPGTINSSSFVNRVNFTAATGSSSIYEIGVGDVDGDGKPDILTANYVNGNTVTVFRNTSSVGVINSSSLASGVNFTTGTLPTSVTLGDIDRDGLPDMVVVSNTSQTISVYRNTATTGSITSGSFASAVNFNTGVGPRNAELSDVDGDGKVDIIVANRADNTVSVYLNTSTSGSINSSSLASRVNFYTSAAPNSVSVADFDGDGKLDICIANNVSAGSISVLQNHPLLTPPTVTALTPAIASPGTPITITGANFNATSANNTVYFGATKATVTAASTTSLTVTAPVGATYSPVIVNNAATTLAGYSQYPFLPKYDNSAYISNVVNFNNRLDVANGTTPSRIAYGDVDGDGKSDLLVANFGASSLSVHRNISTFGSITSGSFGARVDFTTGLGPRNIGFGDVDGDGKPDVIVVNENAGTVSVFRNTATPGSITTGSLASKVDFVAGVNPENVSIGDIDGDGKPELVVANHNSATLSIFRNTSVAGSISSASFAAKVDFAAGSGARSAIISDIDMDGKPDIVLVSESASLLSIYKNTATVGVINTSSLAGKVDFTTDALPNYVVAADIDSDGKQDLVVTNYGSNSLSVYRNTSVSGVLNTSSLSSRINFATGAGPYDLSVADINGDSKPDIVVANHDATSVGVFRNTASTGAINSGSFASRFDLATGINPRVATGDIDGDGKADIAVACNGSTFISVFRNNPLSPIIGASAVCVGATIALIDSATGGTWSSSNTAVATVGTGSGVVTGVSAGTAMITYTVVGGSVAQLVTVEASPNTITGARLISVGSAVNLSANVAGGAWTSSVPAVATVGSAGNVVGVAPGTSVISYTLTNSCGTLSATALVNVTNDTLATRAWATYYGGSGTEEAIAIATDAAGNVYVSGYTNSASSIATAGAFQTSSGGGLDAFLVKFNRSGVRQWATYYGGAGDEYGNALSVDSVGNIYLVGHTSSSSGIASSGAHQTVYGGGTYDAFIVKFTSAGGRVWATGYGGNSNDRAFAVTTDRSGGVYVAGETGSTSGIATAGGHQPILAGNGEAFLVKFNDAGVCQWATYYGGSDGDEAHGIAVDLLGNVYITGYTSSSSGIATSGAHQTTYGGGASYDAFLVKFNNAGVRQWGTYFGGVAFDYGFAVATDRAGNVYLVGQTATSTGIATSGAYQPFVAGGNDAFVARFSSLGSLQWSTYYGGLGDERLKSVCVDAAGNIYMVGYTGSASNIATIGGFQTAYGGGSYDAFALKFNSSGIRQWGTYIGGAADDYGHAIAVDTNGAIYVAGTTSSTSGIAVTGAHQVSFGGGSTDGFVTALGNAAPISGNVTLCVGANSSLANATIGGTWTSSNTVVATVGTGSGVVTGVSAGTAVMSYTVRGGVATTTVSINPLPATITGSTSLCVGGTITLNNTSIGGVWSSSSTTIATVSGGGSVTGVTAGACVITYTLPTGCYVTLSLTVSAAGAGNIITTIGGIGVNGYTGDGGVATAAKIGYPSSIVSDNSGNLYFTDEANHIVRKFSFGGVISTVAGNGAPGFSGDGGLASASAFRTPRGLAIDATGNLYVADENNHRIRKITTSGIITTIAGNGTAGFSGDGGAASSAVLDNPRGVAVDAAGNIYISDLGNRRIRKITTSGIISTVAGNGGLGYSGDGGPATAAMLNGVMTLTVDASGNLLLCDQAVNRIRKVSSSGIISTIAGTGVAGFNGDGGPATAALLNSPWGVSVDNSGNILIADQYNGRIRLINSRNEITTVAGNGGTAYGGDAGNAISATFNLPTGALRDAAGNIYIADNGNSRIRKVGVGALPITGNIAVCEGAFINLSTASTGGVWISSNTGVATVGTTGTVTGISAGTALVSYVLTGACLNSVATATITVNAPAVGNTITTIAGTGTIGYSGDGSAATLAKVSYPNSIAIDNSGNVIFAEEGNHIIRKILPNGTITTIAGTGVAGYSGDGASATAATLRYPRAVATDNAGNIYIADENNGRIRKINAAGVISTIAGTGAGGYSGDGGSALTATIDNPRGVAVDLAGNIYIADLGNNRIRKINTSGIITTVAGNGTAGYTGDGGAATAAALNGPFAVAVDASGNIYISDRYNNRVRKVSSAGIISTIAGTGVAGFGGDGGAATAALLNNVWGVAVDGFGNVLIADEGNNRIRIINSRNEISTVAGNGTGAYSGDGGNAVVASINQASGVVRDINGNIYMSDVANHRIRKVSNGVLPITGNTAVCAGASANLSTASTGGAWISGNTGVAIVGTSGTVTGVSAGTTIISYILTGACFNSVAVATVTVNPLPAAGIITSASSVCAGSTLGLTSTATGGVWSSASGNVSISGTTLTGVSAGTAVISYTVSNGCGTAIANATITVNPLPSAGTITSVSSVCAGSTLGLTSTATGGVWSSASGNVSISGNTLTGVSAGTAVISYTVTNGCGSAIANATITVNPLPAAGTITSASSVCAGSTLGLSSTATGGTWSTASGNVSISGNTLTGVSAGTAVISYTVTNGCGTAITNATITVNPLPTAGSITSASSVCAGSTLGLTSTATGGVWSSASSNVSISGNTLTGVSAGTAVISYTVTNGCGTAITNATITVNTLPTSGTITNASSVCAGSTLGLTSTATSGAWSSASGNVSISGTTLTGVSAGTAVISYTVSNGCGTAIANATIIVNPLPSAGTITSASSVCVGSTLGLTSTATGGVWSSASGNVSISGTTLTGVSAGTSVISYTVTNGCGSTIANATVTVNPLPTAGTITSASSVCAGSTLGLTSTATGGVWSSASGNVSISGTTLTGVSAGTAVVSYTVTNGCGSATTTKTITINALANAGILSGSATVAVGATTTLSSSVTGGVWSSSNTAKATVGASTGIVTGVAAGTAVISYTVTNGCGAAVASKTITVTGGSVGAIGGSTTVCTGSTTTLTNATTGGTWSSSATAVATVGSVSGIVSGIAAGTATITYRVGTAYATAVVTVGPLSTPISGAGVVCVGATSGFTNATTGGLWSSSSVAKATVGSATGIVTGIAAGSATITYALGTGCRVTKAVTVSVTPAAIGGLNSVCSAATITLTNTTTGGKWLSGNTGIALVGSATGVVTGVSAGVAVITYYTAAGCLATKSVSVNSVAAIQGANRICLGESATLTDSTTGGLWSSSNALIARVGSVSGIVAGAGAGVANISYTSGGCRATYTLTVSNLAAIGGASTVCQGQTTTLTNTLTGGRWTSGDVSLATVGTSTGVVTGVAAGAVNISYTLPTGCVAVKTLTVTAIGAISGPSSICRGQSVALTNPVAGGTWSSTSGLIATIGSVTGIVNGIANGSTTISYAVNGCRVTMPLTVNALSAITGTTNIVEGQVVTLTTVGMGAWSSSNTGVATVGSGTGQVTGVAAGTAQITFTTSTGCAATVTMTVNAVPAVSGDTAVCVGQNTALSNPVSGGTWSSGNTTIATIGSATGIVYGVTGGTVYITYRFPAGGYTVYQFFVYRLPLLSGPSSVCAGQQITLTNGECCGYFTSSASGVATVDFRSGAVTGVSAGTTVISYTLPTGCITSATVTVKPLAPITGATNVCVGDTIILSDALSGGYWSSNRPLLAGVGSATGIVSGLSAGVAVLSYTLPATGCTATQGVSVNSCRQVAGMSSATEGVFTLLPNPNKGSFTIKGSLASGADEDAAIEIVDMLGQVTYKTILPVKGGMLEEQIQLANHLANGMYLLNIRTTTTTKTLHFVVGR